MKCNRFQSTCNTVASIYYLCQGSYVFISVVLVSLYVSRIMRKLLYRFHKIFVEYVEHGPRRKRFDFGCNPNYVTLGLRLWLGLEWGKDYDWLWPSRMLGLCHGCVMWPSHNPQH